jgi:hypothetical protein
MGYNIEIMDSDAYIPADQIEAACRGMEPMMQPEQVAKNGQGGSWGGGVQSQVWYSWVDDKVCRDLLARNDLKSFLEHWGFDCFKDTNGDLHIDHYDSKSGQEDLMLQNLAPFVAKDTSIAWRGEDGAMWMNVFDGTHMLEKTAKITWE